MKAASQVAAEFVELSAAPESKKPNRLVRAGRRVKSFFQMAKVVEEEAASLIDDTCDIEEPEVCTDDEKKEAVIGELKGLIMKTLRLKAGEETAEDLAEEMEASAHCQCGGCGRPARWLALWLCSLHTRVPYACRRDGNHEARGLR